MIAEVMTEVSLAHLERPPSEEEIVSFRTRAADHFGGAVEVSIVTDLDQLNELEVVSLQARAVEPT